jgi:hypothetical protein
MEENTQKEFLDLNDVVKYKNFDDEFIVKNIIRVNNEEFYNIRLYKNNSKEIISPETLERIETTEIPRKELTFLYKNENKKETKELSPTLKKQLLSLHTQKKLLNNKIIVIISIHAHGKVITLDRGEYSEKFPSNFKYTFWKNIGVCGKIHYAKVDIRTFYQIHNSYIYWIKSLYKRITNFESLTQNDETYNKIKKLEQKVHYNIDMSLKTDNFVRSLPDLFYNHTPKDNCKNYYTCNPEFIPYINKPYIDTPYYADKSLRFETSHKSPLYITIIDRTKTTTITCNKTTDLKKLNKFILDFIKQKKSKDLDISETEKILNDIFFSSHLNISELFRIFELLKVIDYDIDLFLLDYSCSTIGHNIDKQTLKEFLDDPTIAKGGKRKKITRKNKRKTNKRKTKCRR